MIKSIDYESRALHFAQIGMYEAAQVFATLALASATREKIGYDSSAALPMQ